MFYETFTDEVNNPNLYNVEGDNRLLLYLQNPTTERAK